MSQFARLVRMELFKLRRRPLPWILGAIAVLAAFALPLLTWGVLGASGTNSGLAADARQQALDRVVFPGVLQAAIESGIAYGVPLAIILTATAFGGEFAWGTVRLLLGRGEGRSTYVWSKFVAVVLWWGGLLGGAVLSALLAAIVVAVVDGQPGPGTVALGAWVALTGRFAVAWFASAAYVAITAAITVQARSSAVGLAFGLITYFGDPVLSGVFRTFHVPVLDVLARLSINGNLRALIGTAGLGANSPPLAAAIIAATMVIIVVGAARRLRANDVAIASGG